jgi:hypothetical protein
MVNTVTFILKYQGPCLQGRWINIEKHYDDSGSGAHQDVQVCKPQLGTQPADWYWVGQTAFPNYSDHSAITGLAVRELVKGTLSPPVSWTHIWDDHGSHKKHDYNLWHPVAADAVDYIALGSFFRGGVDNQSSPDSNEASRLMTVHKSLASQATSGDQVLFSELLNNIRFGMIMGLKQVKMVPFGGSTQMESTPLILNATLVLDLMIVLRLHLMC